MDKQYLNSIRFIEKIERQLKEKVRAEKPSSIFDSSFGTEGDEQSYELFLQRLEEEKVKQKEETSLINHDFDRLTRLLRRSEETAALSGKFVPVHLFDEDTTEQEKKYVLDTLVCDCIIDTTSTVKWFLGQKKEQKY